MIEKYFEILKQHNQKKTPKRVEILRIMHGSNT